MGSKTGDDGSEASPVQPTPSPDQKASERNRFPVVGLGASAGGLDALGQFLTEMPSDSGMAFVVITHQHIGQQSLMAELLGRNVDGGVRVPHLWRSEGPPPSCSAGVGGAV